MSGDLALAKGKASMFDDGRTGTSQARWTKYAIKRLESKCTILKTIDSTFKNTPELQRWRT